MHRLCSVPHPGAESECEHRRGTVGPPHPQRGPLPRRCADGTGFRPDARRAPHDGHPSQPPRDGLWLHPELRNCDRRLHEGQDLHREARPRTRQDFLRERRILLELRYLPLERADHPRCVPQVPAGNHGALRPGRSPLQHARRARLHPPELPLLPEHLDRLRRDGEGRERLHALCGLRLGRFGHVGFALRHRREGRAPERAPQDAHPHVREQREYHRAGRRKPAGRHPGPARLHHRRVGQRPPHLQARRRAAHQAVRGRRADEVREGI